MCQELPQIDFEATSFAQHSFAKFKRSTRDSARNVHGSRASCAMCTESLQDRVSLVADGAALARDVADAALAGDEAALQSAIEAGADVNSANLKGVHPHDCRPRCKRRVRLAAPRRGRRSAPRYSERVHRVAPSQGAA